MDIKDWESRIIKSPNSTRLSRNKMMRHTQAIVAKYCGRAFSTIASSPMSSFVKDSWKEQDGLTLSGAFIVGCAGHTLINLYHRGKHWYKVESLWKEVDTRTDALNAKSDQFFRGKFQQLSGNQKSTT